MEKINIKHPKTQNGSGTNDGGYIWVGFLNNYNNMKIELQNGEIYNVIGKTDAGHIVAQKPNELPEIIVPAEIKRVIFDSLFEIFKNWIKKLLKIQ